MIKKFNKELYPAPPKRLKKTRWNFDLLNQENQQIQQMARRAFDPANSFIPITPYSQNYEFRRKGQVLRKRHPHPNSWHFPTKSSELNKLLL